MTWYGILGIIAASIFIGWFFVQVDKFADTLNRCPKCGYLQGEDKK